METDEDQDARHPEETNASDDFLVEDHPSDTPGAVDLVLRVLPSFILLPTKTIFIELFVDGILRGQEMIRGWAPDPVKVFTTHYSHWRASGLAESDVREASFRLTHGTLIRQASNEPASLSGIKGWNYKFPHPLVNQTSQEEAPVNRNDISEYNNADDADHGTSQERFYDAMSQFQDVDIQSVAENKPTAGDEPDAEDQQTHTSSRSQKITSIATSTRKDDVARLSQATRKIFIETSPIILESPTSPSLSPTVVPAPSDHGTEVEMLDDLQSNTGRSETNKLSSQGETPVANPGTLDRYLSSRKTAGQFGIYDPSIDSDDEASHLISNIKPLRRTSYAHPGSAP